MTLRHVGEGLYAKPTGQHLVLKDMGHPDPAERGWMVLEVIHNDFGDPLGNTVPVGPIFRTKAEALAWVHGSCR